MVIRREEGLNPEDLRARSVVCYLQGCGRPLKSLSTIIVFINVPLATETREVAWEQDKCQRTRSIVQDKNTDSTGIGRGKCRGAADISEAELNIFDDCLSVGNEREDQPTSYSCAGCVLSNAGMPLPSHLHESPLMQLSPMVELESSMVKEHVCFYPG